MGRFIWPVLITAAALIAVAVSGAGRDTRAELEYLDSIQEQAGALSTRGDALRDVISRLARIDRTELVTLIDGTRADIAVGLELVAEAPPSPTLFAVNALYRQALEAWDAGIGGYASGLLAAADDASSTVVVDNIANALVEIRSGDRLYLDLVEEMDRQDVPDAVAPMPVVVLMPANGELFSLSQAYVVAARSANSGLALRPGLSVSQVTTVPEWEVNPSDEVILGAAETVTFNVVVSNLGNVMSTVATLRLDLTGGPEPVTLEQQVVVLQPEAMTTVSFADVVVQPGGEYEVTATLVGVAADVDPTDNDITVAFTVSEGESSG
ncbi:MAG: hypothetical protein WEE53_09105 [Acidimicrobiia bacterium]